MEVGRGVEVGTKVETEVGSRSTGRRVGPENQDGRTRTNRVGVPGVPKVTTVYSSGLQYNRCTPPPLPSCFYVFFTKGV